MASGLVPNTLRTTHSFIYQYLSSFSMGKRPFGPLTYVIIHNLIENDNTKSTTYYLEKAQPLLDFLYRLMPLLPGEVFMETVADLPFHGLVWFYPESPVQGSHHSLENV